MERAIQVFESGNEFDISIGKNIKITLSADEMSSLIAQAQGSDVIETKKTLKEVIDEVADDIEDILSDAEIKISNKLNKYR